MACTLLFYIINACVTWESITYFYWEFRVFSLSHNCHRWLNFTIGLSCNCAQAGFSKIVIYLYIIFFRYFLLESCTMVSIFTMKSLLISFFCVRVLEYRFTNPEITKERLSPFHGNNRKKSIQQTTTELFYRNRRD